MGQFKMGVRSLVIYNRKTLLLKRSRKGVEQWEYPGGYLEFGEDLYIALRREIKEETGLDDIRIEKILFAVTQIYPQRQDVGITYLCYANSDKVIISHEHVDFVWVNKKELMNLLCKHMLNELIEYSVLDSLEID